MKIITQPISKFNFFILSVTVLFCAMSLSAQERSHVQKKVLEQGPFFKTAEKIRPLSITNLPSYQRTAINKGVAVDKATILSLDLEKAKDVISKNADKMAMAIPLNANSSLELHLVKAKVLSDDFKVFAASNRNQPLPYVDGVHYWGLVKDHPNSLVSISFYKDKMAGIINFDGKFYDLGQLENSNNAKHILYENKDLKEQFELDCSVVEPEGYSNRGLNAKTTSSATAASDNCIKMYLETDFSMFQHYGSVASVTDYVTGAFSQVILLYANESINMVINELVVWDVVDPYPGTNTSDILNQFRTTLNGNYNGDLGHLIIKNTEVSGGRAYLNVICSSTFGVGVSGVRTSYNNVPTYSWTVMVLAHEIGHNLGSPHTHACSWNGNNTAIDDCGNVYYISNGQDDNNDGVVDNLADAQYFSPCFDNVSNAIPAEGGTIMSYCHLNNVGINLGLGFGPQPGDLMRNNVSNAACLTSCGTLNVSIIASTDVSCGGSNDGSATASASGGSGSYSYSWSNGATGASISNLAAGTYVVTVNDGSNTATDSVTITDNNNVYYADTDNDSFGDPNASILACSQPANYVTDNTDCDDTKNTVYPGALEICDGLDNDCLNGIDDGLPLNTYYADTDGDGFGDTNATTSACMAPIGFVSNNSDCDDTNPNINPLADEICDNLDNNCNQSIDEGLPTNIYYADTDGDGFGDLLNTIEACLAPTGYTSDNSDCDDNDASVYPGGSCNDGDVCTNNDQYDVDCNCIGSAPIDSDGDGVCDALDSCPGGDDTVDTDKDGIPDFCDCNVASSNFPSNSLSHTGSGFSTTSIAFPVGSKDPVFTISDINQRINGKPDNRFIEFITVSYIDGNGDSQIHGSYSGSNTSSAFVSIDGFVQSIELQLRDDFDGDSSVTMSVALSNVSYCADWSNPGCPDGDSDGICDDVDACPGLDDAIIGTSCDDGDDCTENDIYDNSCNCAGTFADADNDGVCDANDICPQGDDNIDSDNDGIPDACEVSTCVNSLTSQFDTNPLIYSGGNASSTTLTFTGGNSDVSFSISDIEQRTNGKPSGRYIERVVVTYVDGGDNILTHGTYSGTGSANIDIAGEVKSVTLTLDDAYSGNNGNISLSVNISDVSSCLDSGAAPSTIEPLADNSLHRIKLYPNPAKNNVFAKLDGHVEELKITFYDVVGKRLKTYRVTNERIIELDITHLAKGNFYFISFEIPGQTPEIHKLILMD